MRSAGTGKQFLLPRRHEGPMVDVAEYLLAAEQRSLPPTPYVPDFSSRYGACHGERPRGEGGQRSPRKRNLFPPPELEAESEDASGESSSRPWHSGGGQKEWPSARGGRSSPSYPSGGVRANASRAIPIHRRPQPRAASGCSFDRCHSWEEEEEEGRHGSWCSEGAGKSKEDLRADLTITSTEQVRFRNEVTSKLMEFLREISDFFDCKEILGSEVWQAMCVDPRYTKWITFKAPTAARGVQHRKRVVVAAAPTHDQRRALDEVLGALEVLQRSAVQLVGTYLSPEEKRHLGLNTFFFQSINERENGYQYMKDGGRSGRTRRGSGGRVASRVLFAEQGDSPEGEEEALHEGYCRWRSTRRSPSRGRSGHHHHRSRSPSHHRHEHSREEMTKVEGETRKKKKGEDRQDETRETSKSACTGDVNRVSERNTKHSQLRGMEPRSGRSLAKDKTSRQSDLSVEKAAEKPKEDRKAPARLSHAHEKVKETNRLRTDTSQKGKKSHKDRNVQTKEEHHRDPSTQPTDPFPVVSSDSSLGRTGEENGLRTSPSATNTRSTTPEQHPPPKSPKVAAPPSPSAPAAAPSSRAEPAPPPADPPAAAQPSSLPESAGLPAASSPPLPSPPRSTSPAKRMIVKAPPGSFIPRASGSGTLSDSLRQSVSSASRPPVVVGSRPSSSSAVFPVPRGPVSPSSAVGVPTPIASAATSATIRQPPSVNRMKKLTKMPPGMIASKRPSSLSSSVRSARGAEEVTAAPTPAIQTENAAPPSPAAVPPEARSASGSIPDKFKEFAISDSD